MEWNIKKWKHLSGLPKKTQLLILLLFGILLLVIALPTPKDSEDDTSESILTESTQTATSNKQVSSTILTEYDKYEKALESKVEKALSQVRGVGNVSVMLTLKSSTEQVIEKDSTSESSTSQDETQSSSSKTSVYSQDSEGNQIPYVKKELTPQIEGVIVIADGGDNSIVVQDISEALQALFGVEAHKIKIMKRESS